ncbi:hypothetical protein Tco_0650014 [Tanacetum coccineum]
MSATEFLLSKTGRLPDTLSTETPLTLELLDPTFYTKTACPNAGCSMVGYEHVAMNLTRHGLAAATIGNTCRFSILVRFMDDLFLALDSIVHFGFSNRRLEQTATFSISTNSE